MFDKLSLPILKYGLEVWGLNDSPDQNHFVYGELGRTCLKSRRGVNIIRYWLKLYHWITLQTKLYKVDMGMLQVIKSDIGFYLYIPIQY